MSDTNDARQEARLDPPVGPDLRAWLCQRWRTAWNDDGTELTNRDVLEQKIATDEVSADSLRKFGYFVREMIPVGEAPSRPNAELSRVAAKETKHDG